MQAQKPRGSDGTLSRGDHKQDHRIIFFLANYSALNNLRRIIPQSPSDKPDISPCAPLKK